MTCVLGLTGSIGMGKSTCAKLLRAQKIPVFNADHYVHRILGKNGCAVRDVARLFPKSYQKTENRIDRAALGAIIFADKNQRKKLEQILHPLVRAAEERFIIRHRRAKTPIIVLDIPLLYETGADALCTRVIVVTATAKVQETRVLQRKGMTHGRLKSIRAAQMPDPKKMARADFILETNGSLAATTRDLQKILKQVQKIHARNCS